ncbi:hypothetical protein KI387_023246 [Taxus chinensis]|uniref:F-box domain-containing protein n=1 Tax=Taxus chinensis TaxID=29808 RepID=A0AA38G1Q2_TAXCH|nr:hypothetical protein KI387_023246 [Taxus chinensis]
MKPESSQTRKRVVCSDSGRNPTKIFKTVECRDNNEPMEQKYKPISYFLQRVFSEEKENVKCDHDLLIIFVHAVMLELGFVRFDAHTSEACLGFDLPQRWSAKDLVSSIRYTLPQLLSCNADDRLSKHVENLELKFQLAGIFLVVDAKDSQCSRLWLEVEKFMPCIEHSILSVAEISSYRRRETLPKIRENFTEFGKDLEFMDRDRDFLKLCRDVKDGLCLPLLGDMSEKASLPLPPSLMTIPMDIRIKIMESLHGIDAAMLCCVCTEFRHLCSNDEFWKHKCIKFASYAFQDEDYRALGAQSWKDVFRLMWRDYSYHSCPSDFPYSPISFPYSPPSIGYLHNYPIYSPTDLPHLPTSSPYSPTSRGYPHNSPICSPADFSYSYTSSLYSPSSPRYPHSSPIYSSSPGYPHSSLIYSPSPILCPYSPDFPYSSTSSPFFPASLGHPHNSPIYSPSPILSPYSPYFT